MAEAARQVARFLRGEGFDHCGRSLSQILALSDAELEYTHDFVQWLFPSPEPSSCLLNAPVLSREDFEQLRADPQVRAGVLRAFVRMLRFYGLSWSATRRNVLPLVHDVAPVLQHPGHNDLRISRMLRALYLLRLHEPADALLAYLTARFETEPGRGLALHFWRQSREWL